MMKSTFYRNGLATQKYNHSRNEAEEGSLSCAKEKGRGVVSVLVHIVQLHSVVHMRLINAILSHTQFEIVMQLVICFCVIFHLPFFLGLV